MSDRYSDLKNYSTGRYAVVDAFYRHIWLNMTNEQTAHQIKKVFWSKTPTLIFDLNCFDNYSDNTVDSDVSLNWLIPRDDLLSDRTQIRLTNASFQITHTESTGKFLINESSQMPLTKNRQGDLQKQMLLYRAIYESMSHYWDYHSNKDFYNQVDWTFESCIDLDQIKAQLYNLASDNLLTHTTQCCCILRNLDRLYE